MCAVASSFSRTAATTLIELGSACVGEAGGRPLGPEVHALWPGAQVAGPAFTALSPPGDNLAAHAALVRAPRDSVVVLATSATTSFGYWGEILASAALQAGMLGLVTDGGVRDVNALERLEFPSFGGSISLAGCKKEGGGETGVAVTLSGVVVHPGDWIVADRDGVVVIAADAVDETIARAQARSEAEAGYLEKIRNGVTTVELLGLDARLSNVPAT
jgi:4-hydroxy-4-methyl-2-oxoglutarate aldolase